MTDPTLPPGTTHADIDKHFGAPEKRTVHGSVVVAVSVDTQHYDDDEAVKKELRKKAENGDIVDALNVRIDEIE